MAFTESYVQPTGSNLNAGSTASDTATYTSTNGGWNSGTGVFSPASGNPSLTVSVGDFASIYTDGSTVTGFVGRVTAVSSTTLTVSITAKSGAIPTTGASGISCKVGGAWKGPNGAETFPFNFIAAAQTNAAGDAPRVNGKGTSNITAAMTHSLAGPTQFEGHTTTPGDGGRWIIDGGTSGASYVLLTVSTNTHNYLKNLIFQNNGATGTANGVLVSAPRTFVVGCVFNSVRNIGLSVTGTQSLVQECEAYSCNQSNTSNGCGFSCSTNATFERCISHDNTGSGSDGFVCGPGDAYIDCIADSNGRIGFNTGGATCLTMFNCDAYNNGNAGVGTTGVNVVYLENCNFLKNGEYGIHFAGSCIGEIRNCGFGSGTQANTSGMTTGTGSINITGSIIYPANTAPWVDPTIGDFRINLAQARGAGRGSFTQTQAGYAGTVAYPDIGAGQHQDSGGAILSIRRRLVVEVRGRPRRSVVLLPALPPQQVPILLPARTRQYPRAAYPVRQRQPLPVQGVVPPAVQSVIITSPRIVR